MLGKVFSYILRRKHQSHGHGDHPFWHLVPSFESAAELSQERIPEGNSS